MNQSFQQISQQNPCGPGESGMIYIESAKKKKVSTKITILGKDVHQKSRQDKYFPTQIKAERIHHH